MRRSVVCILVYGTLSAKAGPKINKFTIAGNIFKKIALVYSLHYERMRVVKVFLKILHARTIRSVQQSNNRARARSSTVLNILFTLYSSIKSKTTEHNSMQIKNLLSFYKPGRLYAGTPGSSSICSMRSRGHTLFLYLMLYD